jgi:hypothetical protein
MRNCDERLREEHHVMSTPTMDDAAKVLADPTSYADEPRLHAALTHLRAHAPVCLVDVPPYRSFWAITKLFEDPFRDRVRRRTRTERDHVRRWSQTPADQAFAEMTYVYRSRRRAERLSRR